MGIDFRHPLLLLLLVPAVYAVWSWWRHPQRIHQHKRTLIACLRLLVFTLLILALAGTQLLFPVREETVVFVVDRSASIRNDAEMVSFLQEAIADKWAVDRYGIVTVGADAAVEQPLTADDQLASFGTEVNPHATNLADGIRLAAGMIPSQARGKIVVLTDGLATRGDAASEARLAKERGIPVEAAYMEQPVEEEVLISSVRVPDRLRVGEEFSVAVDVESTVSTRATLRLYEGAKEAGTVKVSIDKGKNRFVFAQTALAEGFHRYRVELEPERDTIQANNQAFAFVQAAGSPRVLVLEGRPGAAANLVNALAAGKIQADVRRPELLPKELHDFKQYASIVLVDVAATQFSETDMERMQTAVRDLGIGLVMTGGQDSFGLGGWFKTPVEEALPVYMDLRGKEDLPSLGLVLVIDKSGSMSSGAGINKMELAKEAAIRATEMLNGQDQISVIAFDGSPWMVVEPQPVTKLDEIHEQIASIYADGGTDIFPALELAYQASKQMDTQRKHVILLTDGQSGRDDNYEGLLAQMTGENITVSTVAVGDDADIPLLELIANEGKGRHYIATDPGTIPTIFSKETALASRTFVVEKPQVPRIAGGQDISALRQGLPPIHAYVATTPKQTAEQLLVSMDEDPIIARWQYGLGRAVVWTSDLEGKWSPAWVEWEGNSALWNQLVSWTFPQISDGGWKVETVLDGMNGTVTVTLPEGVQMPQMMETVLVGQQLQREIVPLKPTAPRVFQGTFTVPEPGSYLLQISEKAGDRLGNSQTAGLTVSYSPEYGVQRNGREQLAQLLAAADGKLLSDPKEVFAGTLLPKWEKQDISEWLLMLTALLWPLDAAARRLRLPERWRERIAARLRRGDTAQTAEPSRRAAMLDTLGSKRFTPRRQRENEATPVHDAIQPGYTSRHSEGTGNGNPTPSQKASQGVASSGDGNPAQDPFNRLLAAKQRGKKP